MKVNLRFQFSPKNIGGAFLGSVEMGGKHFQEYLANFDIQWQI